MDKDLKGYWKYLEGLPRKDILRMAEEELLDVRGLSKVRGILQRYNITHVTIDHRLQFSFKKSPGYSPKCDLEKDKS